MIKSFFRIQALSVFLLIAANRVGAEVRVLDDEIIFTLKAPGARSVYLVGDFNNWNPTVELMTREGEKFVTSLFLVAGKYRYKFVVDGKWIPDPDNPPVKQEEGSLLVLVEKAGQLVLRLRGGEKKGSAASIWPHVRYLGRAYSESGKEDSDQQVDFNFQVDNEIAKGGAIVKTKDNTWKLSPLRADLLVDRWRLEMKVARGRITGFENDSTWTSHDPLSLFGNVGIYGYNFGFDRRGISLDQEILHMKLRAVYSDRVRSNASLSEKIPLEEVSALVSSDSSDTSYYKMEPNLDDEDVFGGEIILNAGDFEIGYGKRRNRGMHPGIVTYLGRKDSLLVAETFNTREYWSADVIWVRSKLAWNLGAYIGYGTARGRLRHLQGEKRMMKEPQEISLGGSASPSGWFEDFQKSHRLNGSLYFSSEGILIKAFYEHNVFEFLEPIYENAKARINLADLSFRYNKNSWRLEARLEYTDQHYGDTPDLFHIRLPARNFWLDYGDKLRVEDMVGFNLSRYSTFNVTLVGNPKKRHPFHSETKKGGFSYKFEVGGASDSFFGDFRYAYMRCAYERFLKDNVYFQLDAREAYYPGVGWDVDNNFVSSYMEVGYRTKRVEISLGFGFDPVVFDKTRNDYFDIGREEFLRKAAGPVTSRKSGVISTSEGEKDGNLAPLKSDLLGLEKELEKNTTLKLEWIVLF